MCGDIELNAGPGDDVSRLRRELANVVRAINAHVDTCHDELRSMLDDVRSSKAELEQTARKLNNRLATVEARVNTSDQLENPFVRKAVADAVSDENTQLRARLDEFEDRSRGEV